MFGANVDFGQLVKVCGEPGESQQRRYSPAHCTAAHQVPVTGEPNADFISTRYVERQDLNMRMSLRRFTRLTNAFSKRLTNHVHALALYFVWHNFCRRHGTRRTTPAQATGLADDWRDAEWIVPSPWWRVVAGVVQEPVDVRTLLRKIEGGCSISVARIRVGPGR